MTLFHCLSGGDQAGAAKWGNNGSAWRFHVGAGGEIAPVFGLAPPVWHDAVVIVTMNNIKLCFVLSLK